MRFDVQMECLCGYKTNILPFGNWRGYKWKHCNLLCCCDNCSIVFTRDVLNINGLKKYNRCPNCNHRAVRYGTYLGRNSATPSKTVFQCKLGSNTRYYLRDIDHYCPSCKAVFLRLITPKKKNYEELY
jgi:hypothetical protein